MERLGKWGNMVLSGDELMLLPSQHLSSRGENGIVW